MDGKKGGECQWGRSRGASCDDSSSSPSFPSPIGKASRLNSSFRLFTNDFSRPLCCRKTLAPCSGRSLQDAERRDQESDDSACVTAKSETSATKPPRRRRFLARLTIVESGLRESIANSNKSGFSISLTRIDQNTVGVKFLRLAQNLRRVNRWWQRRGRMGNGNEISF